MDFIFRRWALLRQKYWAALAFDTLAIILVLLALHAFNTRHLLPENDMAQAPDFQLASLDQGHFQLVENHDRTTILYFFSPSCR